MTIACVLYTFGLICGTGVLNMRPNLTLSYVFLSEISLEYLYSIVDEIDACRNAAFLCVHIELLLYDIHNVGWKCKAILDLSCCDNNKVYAF